MSNYAGYPNQVDVRSVKTTDATVTTLDTFNIKPDTCTQLKVYVVARRAGGASGSANDCASYEISGTFKDVSGVATILGSLNTVANEDQAAWDATLTASGPNVLLTVTGASGNNVTWNAQTLINTVVFG